MQKNVVTLEDVKSDKYADTLIRVGNENLGVMGYTEHGYRHLNLVANVAYHVIRRFGYPQREAELAAIAGYLHDIGNVVNRNGHHWSGAVLAYCILGKLGMDPEEISIVVAAVGNHDEQTGWPVSNVTAALILADKSDVHRTRVRNPQRATFDVHDRVNFAVERSFLQVDEERRIITLELEINLRVSSVMDYFEIFLTRMIMCRRAANFLGCKFGLQINGNKLL